MASLRRSNIYFLSCTVFLILQVSPIRSTLPQYPGDPCDPIGEPCTSVGQTECAPDGTGNYICKCHEGLITDPVGKRCLTLPTKPGDACSVQVANCVDVPQTECRDNGAGYQCMCLGDLVQLPNRCMSKPLKPGHECDETYANCLDVLNTTCQINSATGGYYCECSGDLVTDIVGETCLVKPTKPGDECNTVLTPCLEIPNTLCSLDSNGLNKCLCTNGFVTDYANAQCLKIPSKPGEACVPSMNECDAVPETQCAADSGNDYYCKCLGQLVTDKQNGKCLKMPESPGDSCHPTLTPCDSIEFTSCLSNEQGEYKCLCTGDYVNLPDSRCLKKPMQPAEECYPLIAPCLNVNQTDCKMDNGMYLCLCNDPLLTDLPNFRCIDHPRLPGDPCEFVEDPCTNVQNTTCITEDGILSYCHCNDEFYMDLEGRRCVEFPTKPGQTCEPPYTDCSRVNIIPTSTTCTKQETVLSDKFYCKCDGDDFVTDVVNFECLKIPTRPGDPCNPELTPCSDILNTTCIVEDGIGTCSCDEPLVNIGLKCISLPTLPAHECHPTLAPCLDVKETECQSSGEPDFYTCRCVGDLITDPDHNICLSEPKLPGDRCHVNLAPCGNAVNTTCTETNIGFFQCICVDDLVTDPVHQVCLTPPLLPGDSCDPILTPCSNVNMTDCRPDGTGGYFCKCYEGYITANGRCIRPPVNPGDDCDPMLAPCDVIPDTTCSQGETIGDFFCKCNGDLVNWADRCLKAPERPSDACSPQIPCLNIQNTTCDVDQGDFYYCKCPPDVYFTDFQIRDCVEHPKVLGDYCDKNSTTTCRFIPHAECLTSQENRPSCQCPPEYFTDLGSCIILPSHPLDRCAIQDHCKAILNTECRQSFPGNGYPACYCIPGYDLSVDEKSCVSRAEQVGKPCQSDTQCLDLSNTSCSLDEFGQGYCQCLQDTVPSSSMKYCLPLAHNLTDECLESLQCTASLGEFTFCDGMCQCIDGFVAGMDGKRCLKVASHGGSCQEPVQCSESLGELAVCLDIKVCACGPGSKLFNNYCHRSSPLHELCFTNEECIVGTSNFTQCDSRTATCECLIDAIENEDKCYGDLSIGSPCSANLECAIPIHEAECNIRNRTCSCPYGEFPITPKRCSSATRSQLTLISFSWLIFAKIFQ